MVVEDEADIRTLVRLKFRGDPEFTVDGEVTDLDAAIRLAGQDHPDLIVLDNKLDGPMTGLEGAPILKAVSPTTKIILFTASEELRVQAEESPSVDAFLLKTKLEQLVPLSRQLLGLEAIA